MAIGSDVAGTNNRDKRVLLNGQVPRVTTTLRALRSHAKIFDIDQEYLERKKVLISRRNKRSSTKVSTFGQKIIPFWEEAPSQARQACEDFLVAVAELVEGELSTEELHESAMVVYNILRTLNTNSATEKSQKRNELLKSFRHISESISIEKIAELAHKINEWASSYPSNASSSPWLGRSPDEGEFGMGLDFHPPSFEDGFNDSEVLSEIQDIYLPKSGLEDVVGMNSSTREFGDVSKDLSGSNDESVILRWFKDLCDDVAVSGASQFSGDELAMALIRVMDSSDRTSDEIAGEIFDLIGEIQFDQIQKILQHRKDIIDAVHKGLTALKNEKNSGNQQPRMPSYGTQVSVQTSSDRNMEKIRRREDKKNFRRGLGHSGESELEKIVGVSGFSALVNASERNDQFMQSLASQSNESSGLTTALPQGTVRKVFKGYEEVRVPATLTAPMKPGEQLVKIAELDEFAQTAFEGYQTLNRIQSRIFKTAYNTNGNILVCAPTGAGKTNIAMITVLREIGQNFKNGVLQKNNFKVVYVAPMKALAAEVARAFSQRLAPLNVLVRELTGDMQPSKQELQDTQMIVTTPEKWDVITRKSSDGELAVLVKLLIIDEVHLLNDDRGPVIEALVARTLRQVESSQSMIRIVGLSATLPNYLEVAKFLRVNPDSGLFFFDSSYRPVPLTQQYIGVTETNFVGRNNAMNEICYSKVSESVRLGYQAMVFVHSRKDTVKTGRILAEMAQRHGELGLFTSEDLPQFTLSKKEVVRSRNRELVELFQSGFGIHHAGMLRSDRNLTERMFSNGLIKVLVCTATLAWGVNLPAHTVIIKGTQLYDPKAGGWRELGMLDVMQIFGRAGRPQFDKSGEGIIITTHDKLAYYLRLLTHQLPIESQFVSSLKDNLNAEVVLGTVTNIKEALTWLGYTYLFVRMPSNPLAYGMSWEEVTSDPGLIARRKALITDAARALDKAKMIRFDEKSGNLYITDLGRVASHFYIHYTSVETYNEMLKRHMNESELFHMVAHSSEFENIMVREEEQQELETLLRSYCPLEVRGGPEDKISKINILMQVFISRGLLEGFSLIADSAYITDSLGRIMRALFEICVHRGWCSMTALLLEYCKAVDRRIWPHQHPLRQFEGELSQEVLYKLEDRNAELERLYDMEEREIGQLLRHPHAGKLTKQCLQYFLRLHISANVSPITRTVLQVSLTITPDFVWKERWHGTSQRWWIWVEDSDNEHIYHHENLLLTKKILKEGSQTVTFTIPIFEPLPPQYYIRVVSDSWLHAEALHTVSFQRLILPELHPPHTELLDLRPLPVTALNNEIYQSLYKFSHFNPIQTQAFHTLYCTDNNVLLGAPTGSGKTISSELAMLRLFNTRPDMKVVYIAPLKALVKERLEDWKRGLVKTLNKHMVELTGDFTPDMKALLSADIIVSTPEKWDGISRNWHNRSYVMKVGLVIIDEIHLLGGDRGPILEVIVSRMRYISSQTEQLVRFVGLSTALANAQDLGSWLGISEIGLYNFKPSVRPVPLEVHIQGYPGKFYCPRMNSMNKPAYASIMTHSPLKPVLIFVSSRRQTRLTALALIQFAIADDRPRQFVHMSEDDLEMFLYQVADPNLKHTLQFGIGLHHAGLNNKDRTLVEELFLNNKIQVLVSTSTLAWGVNLPAHLVVIKGTEFFDGKSKRYVDFPLTDVLQMMGRAGRPQFDQYGKAVILVHDSKKSFYKKFLYEPFPVESSLHQQLHDHFNAEIVAGTITTKQDAISYLTWTYFFRRLVMNPSYYNLEDTTSNTINAYLSSLVKDTLLRLEDAGCIKVKEDNSIEPLFLGTIASQYYLSYTTVELFNKHIGPNTSIEVLLDVLANATEYDELPVRHNEEKLNEFLAKDVRVHVDMRFLDDPHVKTNLLLQAHFSRMDLPIVDYVTDTKSVLDQGIRIIQALVDMAANGGWLKSTLNAMHLLQMVMQGMWYDEDNLLRMLPNMNDTVMDSLRRCNTGDLRSLMDTKMDMISQILAPLLSSSQLEEVAQVLKRLPRMQTEWRFQRRNNSQEEDLQVLEVEIRRFSSNRKNASAFTPRYPKVKDEGWWLVLGDPASNELYALKRVTLVDKLNTNLRLPSSFGPKLEGVYLYLISDCYIGLDQEYSLQAVRN